MFWIDKKGLLKINFIQKQSNWSRRSLVDAVLLDVKSKFKPKVRHQNENMEKIFLRRLPFWQKIWV